MSAGDISALVLSLREGIEMALVVGIVVAYLGQIGAKGARKWVWAGVVAAAGVSLLALGILNALNAEFEGTTEQIFEGTTMLLATFFLTWMVFWMLRNARYLKSELQRGVEDVLARGGVALVGSVIGLAVAIGVGVLIYAFGRRVDLRTFFRVTTVILILFAAGLFSHAAHEFAEAGLLAPMEGPLLWTTREWLPEDSGPGSILRALLGYAESPHAIEVVAYVAYFVGVWLLSKTNFIRPAVRATADATRTV